MVKLRKWDDQAKVVRIEDLTSRAKTYEDKITKRLRSCQIC